MKKAKASDVRPCEAWLADVRRFCGAPAVALLESAGDRIHVCQRCKTFVEDVIAGRTRPSQAERARRGDRLAAAVEAALTDEGSVDFQRFAQIRAALDDWKAGT